MVYCLDKVGIYASTLSVQCVSFSFSSFTALLMHSISDQNDNKYNSGLCVYVSKFADLSQQYNETSTIKIIVCEFNRVTGLVLSNDQ